MSASPLSNQLSSHNEMPLVDCKVLGVGNFTYVIRRRGYSILTSQPQVVIRIENQVSILASGKLSLNLDSTLTSHTMSLAQTLLSMP